MSYLIKRECYNEKTYNGYKDNPYWKVVFDYWEIGLRSDGYWVMCNQITPTKNDHKYIKERLKTIVTECGINIKNITPLK